jgi:deubiquitinase DESI2
LYSVGCGLHHSGVEILGDEYSFGSGGGIFQSSPKSAPGAQFRESLELGQYDGGSRELQAAIATLRHDFGPDDYHLVRKNCNHFANALSWALLGRTIPAHVNRLADIGVCCSCLLPKDLLEHAPVGDTTADSGSGSGFTSFGGGGGGGSASTRASSLKKVAPAFTGLGSKLGSSNEAKSSGGLFRLAGGGANNNSKSGGDDLVDRREKARKAALARLERNQQDGGGGNTSS